MDDELFYCGSLLHDYGIASPAADRDFTLGSVDRMLTCAHAAGVDDARADLLADGICVHTTPGIKVDADGWVGCYLQWGAMVDGAGLRIWDIAPGNVQEILRRYPRGDFKRELAGDDPCRGRGGTDGTLGAARSLWIALGRTACPIRLVRSGLG